MENAPTGTPAPDPAVPVPPEPSVASEGYAFLAAAAPHNISTGKLPAPASTQASYTGTTWPIQPFPPPPPSPELSGAVVPPQLDAQLLGIAQMPSGTLSSAAIASSSTLPVPANAVTPAVPAAAEIIAPVVPVVVFPVPQQQARSNTASSVAAGATPRPQKTLPSRAAAGGEQLARAGTALNGGSRSAAKKPLTLLRLPMDILRLIVKEVTHTNDLTALARTNSTLYQLAIPHIYSRFDIVWPDPDAPVSEGKSVDALTYGLSTLCLGSAFARTAHRLRNDLYRTGLPGSGSRRPTNFGTADYAKHIRKFSLGNGPPDWVAEYMITKESGKMLGTLVALCVAKMRSLENFVWDMPTGVVSDVFMALASLPDHDEAHGDCKLERIWVRWHNNSLTSPPGTPAAVPASPPAFMPPQASSFTNLTNLAGPANGLGALPPVRASVPYSTSKVEFPTFSVVPPLRSLTVLDIDEVAYLDEMAVLIERSKIRLTELRVGIAAHAAHKDFVQTWDGDSLRQVDLHAHWPGESTIGSRRLGGVFGILIGRICDISKKSASKTTVPAAATTPETAGAESAEAGDAAKETSVPAAIASEEAALAALVDAVSKGRRTAERTDGSARPGPDLEKRLNARLKLATLELERVPVSIQAMMRGIDWTMMTTLTVLSCPSYDNLWRQLRKHFRPTAATDHIYGAGAPPPLCAYAYGQARTGTLRYGLALKSIHTDQVSKALLYLIKETLAPHSLEVLFLQSRRRADHVLPTIQDIFEYAVRPHRASLRKLLVDGKLRRTHHVGSVDNHTRHRSWTIPTRILSYLSSGRMAKLHELAISIYQHDWHPFLQRLPNLAQLRSLHIQHIHDATSPVLPFDLAMQIADVVTLRPEVQLCFVGVQSKCYEVVEVAAPWGSGGGDGDRHDSAAATDGWGGLAANSSVDGSADGDTLTSSSDDEDVDDNEDDEEGGGGEAATEGEEEEEEEEEEDDNDDGDGSNAGADQDNAGAGAGAETNAAPISGGGWNDSVSDTDSMVDGAGDSGSGSGNGWGRRRATPQFRMREIFFYDDKVAIFKARHGRL